MSLERVVRPALPGDISPPKSQSRNRTRAGWVPVSLSIGAGNGSLKTMSGSYTLNLSYYAIKKPREDKTAGSGSFLGITFP